MELLNIYISLKTFRVSVSDAKSRDDFTAKMVSIRTKAQWKLFNKIQTLHYKLTPLPSIQDKLRLHGLLSFHSVT